MTDLFPFLASATSDSGSGGSSLFSFLLLPLMLVAMYFLIIRPNSKRRKDAAKLQAALEIGDEVITTSGIIGTITGEDGPTRFWLEIDDDVQVRIARGGVQGRIEDDESSAANDDVDDEDADENDATTTADGD